MTLTYPIILLYNISTASVSLQLLMHKHCMEVKMKLFIPDAAARKKYSQEIGEQHLDMSEEITTKDRHICERCRQSFSREHILEIHSAFYCNGQFSGRI